MAKAIPDARLDAMLALINGTKLCVCSAQPTTYAEATSTYMLAEIVIDDTDYTAANGDTNGRKATRAAQTGVTITNTGDATHVAAVTTASSRLEYVTTCTTQTLTAAGTVDIGASKIELSDPS